MNDSYNQIVADYSGADGGTGPAFQFSGTSIALQVIGAGTAVLQHTNVPDDPTSWFVMLTQVGAGVSTAVTELSYGRLVITGVARAVVSSAGAESGGAGGSTTVTATTTGTTMQTYKATVAGVGYVIGNIITLTRVWDTTAATPVLKGTVWRNETQNTALAAAPLAAHLELAAGGSGGVSEVVFSNFRSLAVNAAATNIKATAGKVYGWNLLNEGADPVFFKFYDHAAPTAASVPLRTVPLGGFHTIYESVSLQSQLICATAISVRCTRGSADTDNVSPITPVYAEVSYV